MRTGQPIQVFLPAGMKELLLALAARNRRKYSQEVILAIEAHLQAAGTPYQGSTEPEESAVKRSRRKK